MSDCPPVVILLITYERTEIAKAVIRGIKERLQYPNLSWHVADDGSNGGHVEALVDEIGPDYEITHSNSEGAGVGRNMNLGIACCLERADIWLHWEDDWLPNSNLDLVPCVRLLQENEQVGMIRLGRLAANLYGQVIVGGDRLWWMLDKTRNEWAFVGHAAMRHRRFHDAYGPYQEGLTPGRTELAYLPQFNGLPGPDIVWPAWLTYDISDHIGDGYKFEQHMDNFNLTREEAAAKFNGMIEAGKVTA